MMFGSGTGSVRVKFRSGLFRVVYSNPVWIGCRFSLNQVRWDWVHIWVNIGSVVNWIGYKSSRIDFESLYSFNVFIFTPKFVLKHKNRLRQAHLFYIPILIHTLTIIRLRFIFKIFLFTFIDNMCVCVCVYIYIYTHTPSQAPDPLYK